MWSAMSKVRNCRAGGCKKQPITSMGRLCWDHVREYRVKALQGWHDAIAERGSNCENRYEDFTQMPGKPKPTRDQAEQLCFGCKVRTECREVKELKIFVDGVILDGELIGQWEEM